MDSREVLVHQRGAEGNREWLDAWEKFSASRRSRRTSDGILVAVHLRHRRQRLA